MSHNFYQVDFEITLEQVKAISTALAPLLHPHYLQRVENLSEDPEKGFLVSIDNHGKNLLSVWHCHRNEKGELAFLQKWKDKREPFSMLFSVDYSKEVRDLLISVGIDEKKLPMIGI